MAADQRQVRDEIIKEVIAPIMASQGYKRKARAFIKKENEYVKKVNVFTSQWSEKIDLKFVFEISVIGKGVNFQGHRVKELWFELKPGIDLKKLVYAIKVNLTQDVLPYLAREKWTGLFFG